MQDALLEGSSDGGQEETSCSQTYGVDVLSQALGKPDVRGRVKVTGTGYLRAFGKRGSTQRIFTPAVDVEKLRSEISEEFEVRFREREESFAERVASEVQKTLATIMASGTFPFTQMAVHTPHTSVSERPLSKTPVPQHSPVQLRVVQVWMFHNFSLHNIWIIY